MLTPVRWVLLSSSLLLTACDAGTPPDASAKRHSQVTVVAGEGASSFLAAAPSADGLIAVGARLLPQSEAQWLRIARVNARGQLDGRFAVDGLLELPSPLEPYGIAVDVAIDDQDRAVVCGYWFTYENHELVTARAFLLRLTPDGHPDAAFGIDGYAYLPPGFAATATTCAAVRVVQDGYVMLALMARSSADGAEAVHWLPESMQEVLSPASRMIASGSYLVRFSQAGVIDPTFGVGGSSVMAYRSWRPELGIDGQQRLVVKLHRPPAVLSRMNLELHRFLPDGARDTSYGAEGRVMLAPDPDGYDWSWIGRSMQVREDGTVLVVGHRWRSMPDPQQNSISRAESDGVVWRVSADGQRDPQVEAAALSAFGHGPEWQTLERLGPAMAGRYPVLQYAGDPQDLRLLLLDGSGLPLPGDLVPAREIALYPWSVDALHGAVFLSGAIVDFGSVPGGRIISAIQRIPLR